MTDLSVKHHISLAGLLLIAPPIIVFVASDIIYMIIGWQGVGDAPSTTIMLQGRAEAATRIYILTSFLGVCAAAFFSILMFGADIAKLFAYNVRRRLLTGLLIGVLVAAGYFAFIGSRLPVRIYLGQHTLSLALAEYERLERGCTVVVSKKPKAGAGLKPEILSPTDRPKCLKTASTISLETRFIWMMTVVRFVLISAASAVIVGAVSCLAELSESANNEQRAAFFISQQRRLRRYVNMAAVLLVSGMIFLITWMRWPSVLMEGDIAVRFTAQADALGVYFGVTYSIMIASYALPIANILASRLAEARSEEAVMAGDLHTGTALLEMLTKMLVVLAPALAGAIPAVLEALGQPA